MHPSRIFDLVYDRICELRASSGSISSRGGAAPGRAPVANGRDYIADFYLVGRRKLEKKWPRKFQFFQVYFSGFPVESSADIAKQLQIPPGTLRRWATEIRTDVGKELQRAGLFPIRRYGQRTNHDESDSD
jgi:hypothetical protein